MVEESVAQAAMSLLKQVDQLLNLPEGKSVLTAEALSSSREYLAGDDDIGWMALNLSEQGMYFVNLSQLKQIRDVSRKLYATGEILRNAIDNQRNFVVGDGLTYSLIQRSFTNDPAALLQFAEKPSGDPLVVDAMLKWELFCTTNNLDERLNNWEERAERDGETIVRIFDTKDCPTIRFVYPEYLESKDANSEYGIQFNSKDAEKADKYFIKYPNSDTIKPVSADEIIHDKRNVDMETARGLPTAYPVFTNLRRIGKLFVNVSVLAQIQSAIALVRKHETASAAQVKNLANRQASTTATSAVTGQSIRKRAIEPGTILDAPKGQSYDFPAHSVASKNFLDIADKELAKIAARFVQPVSWLLAEDDVEPLNPGSPTVLSLRNHQRHLYAHVEDLFWRVQTLMGTNIEKLKEEYKFQVHGPNIPVAKAVDQARIDQINLESGATSPQSIASRNGEDYTQNRIQVIRHRLSAMENEQLPGDKGNTGGNSGNGGDGVAKKEGGIKAPGGGGNQKV
jgi:hypothetical protein